MADTITHRRVLTIALPIVLSNATVPILGVVDTGVIGQMGEAAPIGAVGIGAIILTAIYWIFGFLRMGTSGLTAQATGAGRSGEVAALLTRSLIIGVGAGVIIIASQALLFAGAFALSPASAEVEGLARQYMAIRVWSAPAIIALYGVTGWLIGQERTRAVFMIQLLMNGTNIVLDLVFVLHMGWGVPGVAWATFIAEWSGVLLGLWLCRDAFRVPAWCDWPRVFDRERLVNMAVVNTDILIRSVLLQAIFVSFLFFGARFGDVQLAANHILLQFLEVTAYAMDGFAVAAEALVGNALGARSTASLRRSALLTSFWGAVTGGVLALSFVVFGPGLVAIMAKNVPVQEAAGVFLPYMVAAPIVGVAAWMLDGIFIGATRTTDMRNMMILSAIIYFVAVIPLMAIWGNHGLWLGLLLSFVVRGATLGWKYPGLEASASEPVRAA
ncbi:MATE family efflux transporter [Yoonia sediminilitoris]|uniref:MATE family multidrug resistance protein n=1 Tax=Yoonia sediminilitoris TaxID=1286148 RepID=A0A2T6KQ99_9RHOB|nr:MATE family efflux transporter [Yoonia sediminilitoris]PUB18722.1 MATE family multidrug resistance protein [Yoonia sediminilitoris]RCW98890.1 MATE family multidrug resistance protein [Yoonia sediminilitoris]